jgi:hypothetical protein
MHLTYSLLIKRFRGLKMRTSTLAIFALIAILLSPSTARAQGFEIGPGGVRVYGQCESLRRSCERGQGGCSQYWNTCQSSAHGGSLCAELRAACLNKERLGEEGMGNCRRYRETCR